ncbi:hypothetical protein ONS95_006436 [Cadophora gregata]|uniref:uncharacterized protein n=1 Tax=Cadophora gregata TaxID=51156 RepID=UPI0026DAC52E|nr:uncharacterized protein ONS95_006436 [Cadophora gregata]KAK0101258.1 hypothetical protein ONS95_006436 [Cadophora gregata]KAK0106730.1 hypothetical protein ONS96_004348 [Cadophora gregata f. sp. sojae]
MTVTDSALRLLTAPLPLLTTLSGPSITSSSPHPHHTPELMRRTSWGSVSSSSSASTADTELREWDYRGTKRRSTAGEQDEVERKRWEGRRMRDRLAERTWREFWG